MNPLRKLFCRSYQAAFHIASPLLPYREPERMTTNEEVVALLQRLGISSVLLVTDTDIARLGLIDRLRSTLADAGIEVAVYSEVVPNPTLSHVDAAAALYREHACGAVIGFGGGSSMDCAKGVAISIAKPGVDLRRLSGILKVHTQLPPVIAVPTTAGTGSEVTVTAVFTDQGTQHKFTVSDFCLIPPYALHDYHVTTGLPKSITATTGMDTLVHAVESFIGGSTSPRSRSRALNAARIVHDYLYRAYCEPEDAEARAKMQEAAYDGGIAFSISYVGYVHGVAHSLGGQYGTPHGLANAVALPHFLRAYGQAAHAKLALMARACGIGEITDTDAQLAGKFIDWVDEMNEKMGIPRYIEEIKPKDIPAMARHADKECNPLYPVPVLMNVHELEHMYYVVGGIEHLEQGRS